MEYTDGELMLLEQLTYLNDDVYNAAGIPDCADGYQTSKDVGQLLQDFGEDELAALEAMEDNEVLNDKGDGTHASGAEWAAVIRAAQQNTKINRLEISNVTTVDNSDGNGYNIDAMCFSEPGNKDDAIVCFRGTLNGKEWNDDAEYICAAETDCNQTAMVYINGLPFNNITVVGHSKGANKAAYVYFGSDKVKYCLAMDMPGFPPEYYLDMADVIARKKDGIKCYALESDYVNIMVLPIPGVETIYCEGNGVANFAENHCPNCFFFYTPFGQPFVIVGGEQTEAMKILHDFTAFAALEMPYDERIKVGNYLGDILELALGGGEHSTEEIIDIFLSDPDALTSVVAYFMKYCDTYGVEMGDLFQIGLDIAFNNDKDAEAQFLKELSKKMGIAVSDFSLFAMAHPITAAILVLLVLTGGSIYAYTQLKDIINYIIAKLEGSNIFDDVKSKISALSHIEKLDSLDYQGYGGKKYDYTNATYTTIKDSITSFNNIEYILPSTIWNNYSDIEWYDDICAESIKTALTDFIGMVPTLSDNCGIEFDNTFKNEWGVDDHYMNILATQMRLIDGCIHKFVLLKERMEYNVTIEL